jgi:hypothetical protein
MDVAREAFVRHQALGRWRDAEHLHEASGLDWPAAARGAGGFLERWPYHALWQRRWEEHLTTAAATGDAGAIYAAMEAAVAAAIADEEAARAARGDRPLDLDPSFTAFLDEAYGRLNRQAADTIERGPS